MCRPNPTCMLEPCSEAGLLLVALISTSHPHPLDCSFFVRPMAVYWQPVFHTVALALVHVTCLSSVKPPTLHQHWIATHNVSGEGSWAKATQVLTTGHWAACYAGHAFAAGSCES